VWDSKEVSNSVLITLAVIAITVSLVGIFASLDILPEQITARAIVGSVNVTVNGSTAFTLVTDSINFTTSNVDDTRKSTNAADVVDCTAAPCGFNITNDGSTNINISVNITSAANDLFSSTTNASHFMCNVTTFDSNANVSSQGWTGSCAYGTFIDCRYGKEPSNYCIADINFSDGADAVY